MHIIWCYHFRNWHPSSVSVCLVFLIVKLKHRKEFNQTISSQSITISTLMSRLEPLGTSAVQTKNSPGATTGGQTTWFRNLNMPGVCPWCENWLPCPYLWKLTSMPISAATGSTTSTSSQAASLVPSSSWCAELVGNYKSLLIHILISLVQPYANVIIS